MTTLAVVPILVQAGTTAFAAILAGAGTVLAPLLHPSQWWQWCCRKPTTAALVVSGTLCVGWGLFNLGHRIAVGNRTQTDWAQVAINLIRAEENKKLGASDSTRSAQSPAGLEIQITRCIFSLQASPRTRGAASAESSSASPAIPRGR